MEETQAHEAHIEHRRRRCGRYLKGKGSFAMKRQMCARSESHTCSIIVHNRLLPGADKAARHVHVGRVQGAAGGDGSRGEEALLRVRAREAQEAEAASRTRARAASQGGGEEAAGRARAATS